MAEDFKEMLYSALELKENLPIWCIGLGLCITGPSAGLSTYQVKKRRVYKKIGGLKEQKLLKPKLSDIKQKLGMNPQELGNVEISKSNLDNPLA